MIHRPDKMTGTAAYVSGMTISETVMLVRQLTIFILSSLNSFERRIPVYIIHDVDKSTRSVATALRLLSLTLQQFLFL